jgi:hypothetical protein
MSRPCAHRSKYRRGRIGIGAPPLGLYDYARLFAPQIGRPPKLDLWAWSVIDNWPEHVQLTGAEIDVIEAGISKPAPFDVVIVTRSAVSSAPFQVWVLRPQAAKNSVNLVSM